jgi:mono/diheme cytochrome c family protein
MSTIRFAMRLGCAVLAWWCAAPSALAQAQAGAPAGSAPTAAAGRELFTAHCVRCHGVDAVGTANGPDLRSRVKVMSEDAFGNAVLRRYRWSVPAGQAGGEGAARDAMLHGVLRPRDDTAAMPAWQSQPEVAQSIRSLHRYLSTVR